MTPIQTPGRLSVIIPGMWTTFVHTHNLYQNCVSQMTIRLFHHTSAYLEECDDALES